MPVYCCAILIIVLIISELFSTRLWFAGGAVLSCVAAVHGAGIILQLTIWAVSSILIALLSLKIPYVKKYIFETRKKSLESCFIGNEMTLHEDIGGDKTNGMADIDGADIIINVDSPNKVYKKGSRVKINGFRCQIFSEDEPCVNSEK